MKDLLWAESQKLHRSKILWIAGFATVMVGLIVFAQGQFTFYDRRYIDGAGWFMTAAQSLATFYVLPAVIALLGSYMICREEQEDCGTQICFPCRKTPWANSLRSRVANERKTFPN